MERIRCPRRREGKSGRKRERGCFYGERPWWKTFSPLATVFRRLDRISRGLQVDCSLFGGTVAMRGEREGVTVCGL